MGAFPLSNLVTEEGVTTLTINMARFQDKGTPQGPLTKRNSGAGSSAETGGLNASKQSASQLADGKKEAKISFDRWRVRVPGKGPCYTLPYNSQRCFLCAWMFVLNLHPQLVSAPEKFTCMIIDVTSTRHALASQWLVTQLMRRHLSMKC